jgi:hypothetical protein
MRDKTDHSSNSTSGPSQQKSPQRVAVKTYKNDTF